MAKKEPKAPQIQNKKQMAFHKKDQEAERKVLIGIGAIAGLIVLVLLLGFVQVYVLRPQAPVAKVNGVSIPTTLYQKIYRFQAYQLDRNLQQLRQQQALYAGDEKQKFMYDYMGQNIQQLQNQATLLPQDALTALIDQELVREEAKKRNISASPDEIQKQIETQFGFDRNPPTPTATPPITTGQAITITPTPTAPPMTEDQFKQGYAASLTEFQKAADLTEADFRQMVADSILRDKLTAELQKEVPTTAEQIHPRHILMMPKPITNSETLSPTQQVELQQQADAEAKARAEVAFKRVTSGGEDFAKVATETTDDTSTKDKGGDLDWHARGDLVPEFENVAFGLQPGQIYTDVVKTSYGYHVIKLEEKDPNRVLSDYALQQRKDKAMTDWMAKQTASAKIERFWSPEIVPTTNLPQQQPMLPFGQ